MVGSPKKGNKMTDNNVETRNDLRREQVTILRIEKEILGLAALMGGAGVAGKAILQKTGDAAQLEYLETARVQLIDLAKTVSAAHADGELVAVANNLGFSVDGGLPKEPLWKAVSQLLGG